MEYRRFGRTELRMPVISCGGMRFQQGYDPDEPITDASQQNVEACVRHALELGINHIETARGYGSSELQLGKILPRLPRDQIIVQTKVAPMEDVKQFAETFETSMSLLNLDHIDLFAFHGVNNEACLDNMLRCLDQAEAWRREGRLRFIGCSTHGPTDLIVKTIETGALDYVNLHWYYIFQDNWPAIEAATRRDMGVFIISPNDKGGMLYRPSERLTQLTAPLHPIVFNSLFCLSRPEVHTLSCGIAKPEEFDIQMDAVARLDQAQELVAPIVKRLDDEKRRVLGDAWVDTWEEGLPEWHETPNEINIPWILRLHDLAVTFDMVEFAKMRYNLLGNGGHWFPGRQAADIDQVDLTDCLRNSPHRDVIPGILRETHDMLVGEARKRLQADN